MSGSSPRLVSSWVTKLRRVFSRPRRNRPSQSISSRDTWSARRPWAASTSADQVKSASKAPSWGSASAPLAGARGARAGAAPAMGALQAPEAMASGGAGASMATARNSRWRSARWAAACSSSDNPGAGLAAGWPVETPTAGVGSNRWLPWAGAGDSGSGAEPATGGSGAWAGAESEGPNAGRLAAGSGLAGSPSWKTGPGWSSETDSGAGAAGGSGGVGSRGTGSEERAWACCRLASCWALRRA